MTNSVLDISFISEPSLSKKDVKEALDKRTWSVIKDVVIYSDSINLNFEQSNEFKRLIMEALQKVTRPKPEPEGLQAKKIIHYLKDLWMEEEPDISFEDWAYKAFPSFSTLAPSINTGYIVNFGSAVKESIARRENITVDELIDKVNQLWEIRNLIGDEQ